MPREGTDGRNFLRGYQVSDRAGWARFTTVLPGWYRGRTEHIHLKIQTTGTDGNPYEFTSQLYFTEEFKAGYLTAVIASQVLSYVNGRFTNWLDAFNPEVIDADGGSYQLVQGIFGLAQGGLIGTGLGQGRPYLTPVSESDYILPALGEELGLVGVFAILSLYMVFTSRGIRIGLAGQDDFGKLLATGLSFTIALQVFIMVGGVTRIIPLTGLTTPFLAAGGSSLVANWIIVALLLRISDAVRSRPRVVIG